MLEPRLIFVSEVLLKATNLQESLHDGSVESDAIIYRHRAPLRDHDSNHPTRTSLTTSRKEVGNQKPFRISCRGSRRTGKFKFGYCLRFEHTSICEELECPYKHM